MTSTAEYPTHYIIALNHSSEIIQNYISWETLLVNNYSFKSFIKQKYENGLSWQFPNSKPASQTEGMILKDVQDSGICLDFNPYYGLTLRIC